MCADAPGDERRGERPAFTAPVFLAVFALALVTACSKEGAATTSAPAGASAPRPSPTVDSTSATPIDVCEDERIEFILHPGARTEAFLPDTSDLVPVLVAQLGYGQADPLMYAREQLAALGDAAIPELARFVQGQMNDPNGGMRLQNALGVASLMKTPRAREILLRGLEHPEESVRLAAIRGLIRHPDPADYDLLASMLPISSSQTQIEIADLLCVSDRTRVEDDFCTWFAAEKFPPTYAEILPRIADTRRPETLASFRELLPKATAEQPFFMRAALASNGDAEALASLRESFETGTSAQRRAAVEAFERAGLVDELARAYDGEPEAAVRARIIELLSGHPDTPALRSVYLRGLSDTVREVRKAALGVLVRLGDHTAQDLALEMLKGDRPDLEDALLTLRQPMREDETLARRALTVLMGLRTGEIRPLRVEPRAIDRGLALVPLPEAAAALYASALQPGPPISAVSVHRWYTQQIGNVGRAGADLLREHWRTEPDPERRVDLIAAGTYALDESAREFLITALDDPRSTPCEQIYIALQLCKRGPADRIAPILKRCALAMKDPRVRPAFNSMLWTWFGPPR